MTNAFSLVRALLIYGICLPVAVLLGYQLATPTDTVSASTVGIVVALMLIPLMLRWHYPLLVLAWNASAGFYFLPGKPTLVLMMSFMSFGLSALGYIMNRNLKFISVPTITRPLIFMLIVVFGTAKLTGGIGLNILGGNSIGGKGYVTFTITVLGYFALTARRIPKEKANLYVTMFFLSGLTAAIGNLFSIINPSFDFLFLLFPADFTAGGSTSLEYQSIERYSGIALASVSLIYGLLARYGISGLLKTWWRLPLFLFCFICSLYGGFRSLVIGVTIACMISFYFEGLFKSKLMPALVLIFIFASALAVPFANKLPIVVQRSLTFLTVELHLPIALDPEAEMSSQASTDWRLEMWKTVLPTIPKYLILGKGLSMTADDLDMLSSGMMKGNENYEGALLAGDYHSGPLSVIIPFGIPGVIAFLWIVWAGFRVLQNNFKYGDPTISNVNRFLLVFYLTQVFMFFFIVGSLSFSMLYFLGTIGMSVAVNGGMIQPAREPVVQQTFRRMKLIQASR